MVGGVAGRGGSGGKRGPHFRRGLDGLGAQFGSEQFRNSGGVGAHPQLVWDWYEYRRELVSKVRPNAGHYAIAELEDMLPQVIVITQNIDGLHQAAGSSDVITLHGDITRHKCYANCKGDPTLIDVNKLEW